MENIRKRVGLHVTQVKNKIAFHSINKTKKFRYYRRVINQQHINVSGLCDIPYLSNLAKCTTRN